MKKRSNVRATFMHYLAKNLAEFCVLFQLCCPLALLLPAENFAAQAITPRVDVAIGTVNSVVIKQAGKHLAIYGASSQSEISFEKVLITHHRRDVVWKAREAISPETAVVAAEAERNWLEKPAEFWNAFTTSRFHDYAQQTTKVVAAPLPVTHWVNEGDIVHWRGIDFQVVSTSGYTPGAISYITTIDNKTIAFTGDLIYGDGQLFDLYSLQSAIPGADIRGYHGYAGRLAGLVASLRKLSALDPDMIVPARGPIIEHPRAAINRLIGRVQQVYQNYLSTSALHWYFKEDRMRRCGGYVLGEENEIELMPYSLHEQSPDWVFQHATSRLLISDSGHGFLLDCGYQGVIDAVHKMIEMGLVKQVDGIFVTHYHDDHTDKVQTASEEFNCPVYAVNGYADILLRPAAYHMPCMTTVPIRNVISVPDGEKMKWQEFEFTFEYFPGQTFYHGALLARKANERPIFFIGDAFSPSGIDDYCLMNRNLVHEKGGYQLCFQKLRNIDKPFWLINEHIGDVFTFSDDELTYLETRYRQRAEILSELFPWDSPNYGIDEQWAVFYPYGLQAHPGEQITLEIRITNHSPANREFFIQPRVPDGLDCSVSNSVLTLEPGDSGSLPIVVEAPPIPGNYVITSDIRSESMEFQEWIEALVTVEK